MKIGVIVDNELNNDIRVLREINILKQEGHGIYVLCFAFNKKSREIIPGITIRRIAVSRWIKDTLFFFMNFVDAYEILWSDAIGKFIRRYGIEALHVHDLYMSKASYIGIKRSGRKIPLILDLHENFPYTVTTYNWTKGFFRHLISQPEKWLAKEKEYLGYADRYIVLSNEFRNLLAARYPELKPENFATLPNVPDLSVVNRIEASSVPVPFTDKAPVIFYYGVIAERRGIFDALKVFTDLAEEAIPANLLFIGPVDKKDRSRFFRMISDPEIADRVHYIPWIDFSRFWSWLKISDICIAPFHKNPQHESGIANKVFDYMLGGKPLVASDCLPQMHLIETHNCGIVFRNESGFREALLKLLNDRELRKKMGENGRNAILQEYNVENIRGNLINIYRNIQITR